MLSCCLGGRPFRIDQQNVINQTVSSVGHGKALYISIKADENVFTKMCKIKCTKNVYSVYFPEHLYLNSSTYRKTSISLPWRSIFQPFPHSGVLLEVTFN